jgi:hypothetical protein
MLLTAAVGIVDAATRAVLVGLVVIGPCMAIATRRAYPTALVGVWATACSVAFATFDGISGTHLELEYTTAVAVVAALSIGIAVILEHHRSALDDGEAADVDLLVTLYAGVFDRAPDREGLVHQRDAIERGESWEGVLRGMVMSPEAATLALYRPGTRNLVADYWSRGADARRVTRPICFLHTMKTGGTSLERALVELAGPWPYLAELMLDHLACLPGALLGQAMLIAGHLPYEALDLLPDGMALCTVVRDPVERTLSHHAHLNGILAARGQATVGIDEFIGSPQYHRLWKDYQARQLVHRIGLKDAWKTFSPVEEAAKRGLEGADAELPLQSLFDSTPLALEGDALAQAALDRLGSIDFVGTTDSLDALVARLAAAWHRPAVAVPAERVSTARTGRGELRPATLDAIVAGTMADGALYERARAIAAPGGRHVSVL